MLRTLLICAACAVASLAALADPKTVCTITVNSADEKEAMRARLPPERYRFVELLQKGRADWLANACASAVQCDVLVVSGHFNAGDTFYSDRVETSDHLDVDQLERASCSGSCPGLFARLKEVYLFGCESLNPDASRYSSSHGDSGRARMQRIFANAALIYGFSGAAPVGPTAAMLLNRHFDAAPRALGSGMPSAGLLRAFSANGMTTARGIEATGAPAAGRAAICGYFDERVTPARKLEGIHAMMRRDMAEVRANHDRITGLLASLTHAERLDGAYVQALATISADAAARTRYLAAIRAERGAPLRLRMIALAATFAWLTPAERQSELGAVVDQALASRAMGLAETSLICALDASVETGLRLASSTGHNAAATAALACLGDVAARASTLQALASPDERAVQAAQVFLRHRPYVSPAEMRDMVREIAVMPGEATQVRALDALGRLPIADREVFDALARLFAAARSIGVQRAIAEVYLRSSLVAHAQPGLAGTLRRHRIGPPGGADLIDQLLGRLAQA